MQNIEININKIIKTKRKTFKIEIDDNSFITLRIPLYATQKDITEFLEKNILWIQKTISRISTNPKFVRKYEDGEKFLFLGENYFLIIQDNPNFHFKFDGNNFIISKKALSSASKYFENFYKDKARVIIYKRVYDIAIKLGIKFHKLRITSASTRWGSCNSIGNVSFSWRLIMAKPTVIDYVIIHEFCHLFEFNHSAKFWELVEKIMPDYKIHKKWLDENTKYMIL
jgi:predicted metal-dependent hydrolase